MTLDDLEGSLCTLFQNTCVFRSSLWKFEWRWIYTVSDQDVAHDSSFCQYKVCADIRGGLLERGRQTTVGSRKHGFSRLSTLRLQHVKKWDERYYSLAAFPLTPNSPKSMTLADSEWLECSLGLYVTVLRFAILPSVIFFLLIYCRVCLRIGTARDPHRSAGSGV